MKLCLNHKVTRPGDHDPHNCDVCKLESKVEALTDHLNAFLNCEGDAVTLTLTPEQAVVVKEALYVRSQDMYEMSQKIGADRISDMCSHYAKTARFVAGTLDDLGVESA